MTILSSATDSYFDEDTWSHVAVSFSISSTAYTAELYIDGESIADISGDFDTSNNGASFSSGMRFGAALNGYIDEVALYTIALDASHLTYVMLGEGVSACSVSSNPFALVDKRVLVGDSEIKYATCNNYYLTVEASADDATITCTYPVSIVDINDAPILQPLTKMSVPERTKKDTYIGEALNASDVDFGQAILFSINNTRGDGADGMFGIGKCSGEVYVANSNLDYVSKDFYELYINIEDDGSPVKRDTGWVQVTVTNVNDAPVLNASRSFTFKENVANKSRAEGNPWRLAASDPDGDALVYSISSDIYDTWGIDGVTGALKNIKDLNYEASSQYQITVKVTDGSLSDSGLISISIEDQNDAPVISDASRSVDENSAVGTIVGSVVTGTDEDSGDTLTYSIDSDDGTFEVEGSTGQIKILDNSLLDYEGSKTKWVLPYTATDSGASGKFDFKSTTVNVTVTLNNVNERPLVTSEQVFYVFENATFGTTLGSVSASDPDNAVDPDYQTLTYTVVNGTDSKFTIDPQTGELSVLQSLNFEQKDEYKVYIKVQDNGATVLADQDYIIIKVRDNNERPRFPADTRQRFIAENTCDETVVVKDANGVVAPINATDPDWGQTELLMYSITADSGQKRFAINATTGVITVNATGTEGGCPVLNYEFQATYRIQVTATDPGGLTVTKAFAIELTNVYENPVMPDFYRSTTEAAYDNGEYTVGAPLEPTDEDTANGETITSEIVKHLYLTSGVDACTDAEAFSISSDGQISLIR